MGRYSLAQRAKSYGEMAKLLGILDEPSIPGLGTVCAITSAYELEVMDDRRDDERISAKLRSTGDRGIGCWRAKPTEACRRSAKSPRTT